AAAGACASRRWKPCRSGGLARIRRDGRVLAAASIRRYEMYRRFFGLRELPFELTSNPRFLFLTAGHREALSTLHYGVSSGKSITVLIGQAGMGKTTLLRTVLESDEHGCVRWVCLNNPILTREDFLRTLASRFELSAEAARSKSAFLDELEGVLRDRRSRGEISTL